ncbi:hypothetical protein AB0L59_30205 [Streptomyces sp. NPDC052109]|uniref:hypothetical protein n=1 Tax=Streptomyces sp. NPDC052109 TaxID=3155527 RepID=UPI0034201646
MTEPTPAEDTATVERLLDYWLEDLGEREGRPATRTNAIEARWKGGVRKLTADEANDFDEWVRTRANVILLNPDSPEGVRYKARQDQQAVARWLKAEGYR